MHSTPKIAVDLATLAASASATCPRTSRQLNTPQRQRHAPAAPPTPGRERDRQTRHPPPSPLDIPVMAALPIAIPCSSSIASKLVERAITAIKRDEQRLLRSIPDRPISRAC
jgi:hypothetical protein